MRKQIFETLYIYLLLYSIILAVKYENLVLWFKIPLGGMDICRDNCVLSGRGLCDELITRPEESCRL